MQMESFVRLEPQKALLLVLLQVVSLLFSTYVSLYQMDRAAAQTVET